MNRKRLSGWLILILALIGIVTAASLSMRHYKVLSGNADSPSFCSFSKNFDCDKVTASREAEVFGYPLSSIGLALYLVLAALSLFVNFLQAPLAKRALSWIIALSLLALIFDLYLGGVLLLKLHVFCLLCIATYFINLTIFISAFKLSDPDLRFPSLKAALKSFTSSLFRDTEVTRQYPEARQTLIMAGAVLALLISLSLAMDRVWLYRNEGSGATMDQSEMKRKVREAYKQLEKKFADFAYDQSPQYGPKDAPVTLVEFSDFECPFCRRSAFSLKALLARFPDKVRLVFKNFPLDQSCNSTIPRPMHLNSCMYARAAWCARMKAGAAMTDDSRFWRMHDFIFQHEDRLSVEALTEKAVSLGLEASTFTSCLASEAATTAVKRDVDLGITLEIHSTPTFYLNGRRWDYGVNPKVMEMLVEVAMENP